MPANTCTRKYLLTFLVKQIVAFPPRTQLADARATQKKCDFRSFSLGPAAARKAGGRGHSTVQNPFLQNRVITALASHKNWSTFLESVWARGERRVAPFHHFSDVGNKNWVQLSTIWSSLKIWVDWGCVEAEPELEWQSTNWAFFSPDPSTPQNGQLRDQSSHGLQFLTCLIFSIFAAGVTIPFSSVTSVTIPFSMFWQSKTWMTTTCFGTFSTTEYLCLLWD